MAEGQELAQVVWAEPAQVPDPARALVAWARVPPGPPLLRESVMWVVWESLVPVREPVAWALHRGLASVPQELGHCLPVTTLPCLPATPQWLTRATPAAMWGASIIGPPPIRDKPCGWS